MQCNSLILVRLYKKTEYQPSPRQSSTMITEPGLRCFVSYRPAAVVAKRHPNLVYCSCDELGSILTLVALCGRSVEVFYSRLVCVSRVLLNHETDLSTELSDRSTILAACRLTRSGCWVPWDSRELKFLRGKHLHIALR